MTKKTKKVSVQNLMDATKVMDEDEDLKLVRRAFFSFITIQ